MVFASIHWWPFLFPVINNIINNTDTAAMHDSNYKIRAIVLLRTVRVYSIRNIRKYGWYMRRAHRKTALCEANTLFPLRYETVLKRVESSRDDEDIKDKLILILVLRRRAWICRRVLEAISILDNVRNIWKWVSRLYFLSFINDLLTKRTH
jgi:hypothetical protein